MKPILTILAAASLAVSCAPIVIDEDMPSVNSIVVNAYPSADSSWLVGVTTTRSVIRPFNSRFEDVGNATVGIYEGDRLYANLAYRAVVSGSYFYTSLPTDARPVAGKEYTIRVSVPGYDDVLATSRVPHPVALARGSWKPEPVQLSGYYSRDGAFDQGFYGAWVLPVSVEFDDPPGPNYYEVMVKLRTRKQDKFEFGAGSPFLLTRNQRFHPVVPNVKIIGGDPEHDYFAVLFEDTGMDGKRIVIEGFVPAVFGVPSDPGGIEKATEYQVILRNVNRDYFEFFRTQEIQVLSRGDTFSQPAPVHSNVINGLGIFAGYSESSVELERR